MYILIGLLTLFSKLTIASAPKKALPVVEVSKATKSTIDRTLFYPAQISSEVESRIKSDDDYTVLKVYVKLGETVSLGAPLFKVKKQNSIEFKDQIIRSSVDGVVGSISVKVGQFVQKNQSLIYINDPQKLYGSIEISPMDYQKFHKGLKGNLSIVSLDIKSIPIQISSVGGAVDSLTGTITVNFSISKKYQEKLIAGTIGTAEIFLSQEELLLVKEKSLYYIGDKVFLPKIKNSIVEKIEVTLGKRIKDSIEVTKGLNLGSEYVSDSPKFLRDGEEVRLKNDKKVVR